MTKVHIPKTVFLDRDGVINRDSPAYIKNRAEFHFLPRSIDAISKLTRNGFQIIIISNQSAINRGILTLSGLCEIHADMQAVIERAGGRILDIFICPHRPNEGCDCRKPKPGLIRQAQSRYELDLARAVMVGDNLKDMQCARNAGCGYAVLVKSGYAPPDKKALAKSNLTADFIGADLSAAAEWILEKDRAGFFTALPDADK